MPETHAGRDALARPGGPRRGRAGPDRAARPAAGGAGHEAREPGPGAGRAC